MAKLTIKESQMKETLDKLTPCWVGCVDAQTLAKAQESQSITRNWLFGTIINSKFIKLNKKVDGMNPGSIVSLTDIYDIESARSLAGLIIYRLGHSGLIKQPKVVEA